MVNRNRTPSFQNSPRPPNIGQYFQTQTKWLLQNTKMFYFLIAHIIYPFHETTPSQIHLLVIECAHYKLHDFSKTRLFLQNTLADSGIVNLDSTFFL